MTCDVRSGNVAHNERIVVRSKNRYDRNTFLCGGGGAVSDGIYNFSSLKKMLTPGNSFETYKLFAGNIYHTLFTAQDAEDRCYADSFAELQVV